MDAIHPESLIAEVKKRPGLYVNDYGLDRSQKLALWRDIGASLFDDWESWSKTDTYDKVVQLQKKWRSLRDAYNRELRAKKTGVRTNRREYMHFKLLRFLSGSDEAEDAEIVQISDANEQNKEKDAVPDDDGLLVEKKSVKIRKRVTRSKTKKSREEAS